MDEKRLELLHRRRQFLRLVRLPFRHSSIPKAYLKNFSRSNQLEFSQKEILQKITTISLTKPNDFQHREQHSCQLTITHQEFPNNTDIKSKKNPFQRRKGVSNRVKEEQMYDVSILLG